MDQKQKLFAGGALVVVAVGIYAISTIFSYSNSGVIQESRTAAPASQEEQVPQTADAIAEAIIEEGLADEAALDAEASGEAQELENQNKSINDLGNSYDESSY